MNGWEISNKRWIRIFENWYMDGKEVSVDELDGEIIWFGGWLIQINY